MKKGLLILICFVFTTNLWSQTEYSIGEIHTIQSKILNEERTLNIHLPLKFSTDSVYPVMYVLDGSAHEDFLHIVGLVQFFQLQMGAPEMIIVGIANVDRKRDFTFKPTDSSYYKNFPTSGHSALFMDAVEKEIIPFIEKKYPTNAQKMLVGQSLGGLMATEFLLKKPTLFSHYFIVSPSLWWDRESMLKDAKTLLADQKLKPDFVYIAVGKKEGWIMEKEARKIALVAKRNKNENQSIYRNRLKGENHATVLHNALYEGFEILYPYIGAK